MTTTIAWDGLNQFLGMLWKTFPMVYFSPTKETAELYLIDPWTEISHEFCDNRQKAIDISTTTKEGGVGQVGPLKINNKQVRASTISFAWDGPWAAIWIDCIVKQFSSTEKVTDFSVKKHKGIVTMKFP